MRKLLILCFIMVTAGCIDPIDLKLGGTGGSLVVDGWVTDQPGPYTITLSRSVPYNGSAPLKVYSVPEKGAKVSIVDDQGVTENLKESVTAGSYLTSTLLGKVGKSYYLQIQTANGNNYRSQSEQIISVPPIQSVEAVYRITQTQFTNANGSIRTLRTEDFEIFANINDPSGTGNFYRWTSDGFFEFFAINDDPLKQHCWAPSPSRLESKLEIASDQYFDGQSYRQSIGIFPYDRPTNFRLHVVQRSLTERAYNFLKQVSTQQTTTGTLFDPPPTAISSNVYNINNSDEVVLGYFGASSETQSYVLINRFNASGKVNPSRYTMPIAGDCKTQIANATNVKPPYF